jgi:formate-dependent nitrite reductase membrane component NrfD
MIWADTLRSGNGNGSRHPTVPVAPGLSPTDLHGVVARTTYTTAHQITWGAKVSGYLVTKAIAAGAMLVAALFVLLGYGDQRVAVGIVPPTVAGLFLAITGALLIADLKQPARFHYLLTKGNWNSWLVKGAYILMAFAAVLGAWLVAGLAQAEAVLGLLALPAVLGALGTAGYTAFLFGQCEGRDFWQTPLLLPVLLAQAVAAGGASWALLDLVVEVPDGSVIAWVLLGGVAATAAFIAIELWSQGSRHVELATEAMTRGAWSQQFWLGGVVLGLVVPAVIAVVDLVVGIDNPILLALGGLAALVGMFAYEDSFVRAGQSVPLS